MSRRFGRTPRTAPDPLRTFSLSGHREPAFHCQNAMIAWTIGAHAVMPAV
jgi:hypothetical protein